MSIANLIIPPSAGINLKKESQGEEPWGTLPGVAQTQQVQKRHYQSQSRADSGRANARL